MKLQLRWMWWMFSFHDVTFWLLPSGPNLCLAAKSLTLSLNALPEQSNMTQSWHLSTFGKRQSRTGKTKSRSTGTRPSSPRNLSLHLYLSCKWKVRGTIDKACPARPPLLPHVLLACKGPILDPWHNHCIADKDSIFVRHNKGFVFATFVTYKTHLSQGSVAMDI